MRTRLLTIARRLLAAILALSLAGCVVLPYDDDGGGGGHYEHHWHDRDRDWR